MKCDFCGKHCKKVTSVYNGLGMDAKICQKCVEKNRISNENFKNNMFYFMCGFTLFMTLGYSIAMYQHDKLCGFIIFVFGSLIAWGLLAMSNATDGNEFVQSLNTDL
jgi:hypothetical protein